MSLKAERPNAEQQGSVMLDEALNYHRRGWSIFPMKAQTKKPAREWTPYQTNIAADSIVREWFGNGSKFGIAVVLGAVSGGLASRDFDTMGGYEKWAVEHPELARTLPTVETVRGRHVYAIAAPGSLPAVREALGKDGGTGAMPFADGELRADVGCYSVLPPSKHPSGSVYRWIIPPGDEIPTVDLLSSGWVPLNREYRGGQRVQRTLGGDSLYTLLSGHEKAIEEAISRTLPTGTSQRHRLLFDLARELKAMPALADAPLADLKPIVKEWHRLAVAQIGTKPFEESWFDFCESWGKVKFPRGTEPMSVIVMKAMEAKLPKVAENYEQGSLRLLVAVCRELQRASGEEPFFLSTRIAGKVLGVSHVTASFWLRGLQHDGILQLVSKGSQSGRKASRYQYLAG